MSAAPKIKPIGQSPTARLALAKGLFERGRYKQAALEVDEALIENPELAQGHFLKGVLEFRTGQSDRAVGSLEQAIRLDESQSTSLLVLAHVQLDRRDADAALDVAERTIALDPKSDRGYFAKGEALLLAERREQAAEAFRVAVRLNPMFVGARLKLGALLVEMGREDEAYDQVVSAQRMNPANFNGRIALGDLFVAKKEYAEALREYRAAGELALLHPVPHFKVGMLLLLQDHIYEAIISFRTALRIDPKHIDSLQALAQVYFDQDWHREALEFAQAALEINSDLPQATAVVRAVQEARRDLEPAVPEPTPADQRPPVPEELVERVYNEYLEARRRCREPIHGLTRERIARTLSREVDRIRQRYPDAAVEFRVVVRDEKARILGRRIDAPEA